MENWYKKSLSKETLEKEAAVQDVFKWMAPAIMAVLMGTSVSEAAQKHNIPEEKLQMAVNNPNVVQEVKKLHFEMPSVNNQSKPNFNLKNLQMDKPHKENGSGAIDKASLISFITKNEGKKNKVYMDSKGIPTIGVGFNLTRGDAPQKLKEVGASYTLVRNGLESLSDAQINKLLDKDVDHAINGASSFVPNFNQLPSGVKTILIDMTFNMGIHKLNGFHNLKDALTHNDWNKAKREMINSAWYKQVGQRGPRLVNLLPK